MDSTQTFEYIIYLLYEMCGHANGKMIKYNPLKQSVEYIICNSPKFICAENCFVRMNFQIDVL